MYNSTLLKINFNRFGKTSAVFRLCTCLLDVTVESFPKVDQSAKTCSSEVSTLKSLILAISSLSGSDKICQECD